MRPTMANRVQGFKSLANVRSEYVVGILILLRLLANDACAEQYALVVGVNESPAVGSDQKLLAA